MKTILTTITLFSLLCLPALAQPVSEYFETGPFDVGRAQTNPTVDGNRIFAGTTDAAAWWNGAAGNTHCNVGWNSSGIWWSYILFGAPAGTENKENLNPGLFNKINTADEIYIHLGVAWLESNKEDFPTLEPGVVVTAYLVPELYVPTGSLGEWSFTWIGGTPTNPGVSVNNYTPVEMFDIDPSVYPPLAGGGTEYRVGLGFPPVGPSEQDKRDHLTRFNITSFVKNAIAQGQLDENTPWGIALYTKDAEPLTANDPKWVTNLQTIIEGNYVILETVMNEGASTWAGYEIGDQDDVQTGSFLGWLNVGLGDWVYVYDLDSYVYLPESHVSPDGAWTYFPK